MALGDPYATLAELKLRLTITDTVDDARLTEAMGTASRGIEGYCGRQFNKQTGATARVFYPKTSHRAVVHDFWTTASLVIATDTGDDGTYETTWAAGDYQLEPLDGVVDGEPGWPQWEIHAVGGRTFPTRSRRPPIQVSAQWGWNAVPAPVHEAALVAGEEAFKLKGAPFGPAVRIDNNPHITKMLGRYQLDPIQSG